MNKRSRKVGRALRAGLPVILLCSLLGGVIGLVVANTRTSTYETTARTTVASAPGLAGGEHYSVVQSIRLSMPSFLSMASNETVIKAAAAASGLQRWNIEGPLSVGADLDSTVIKWKLTGAKPTHLQDALRGAIAEFEQQVSAAAPKTLDGRPAIRVIVGEAPTEPIETNKLPVQTAVLAAELVGILAGCVLAFLRYRMSSRQYDRRAVEYALDIPVVAEAPPNTSGRVAAWRYVSAFLVNHNGGDRLALLGMTEPLNTDVTLLQESYSVLLGRPATVHGASLSDAVNLTEVLVGVSGVAFAFDPTRDQLRDVARVVADVRHIVTGPLCVAVTSSE